MKDDTLKQEMKQEPLPKRPQKSVRVVLPEEMYNRLKRITQDHGDISRIVRSLLRQFIKKAEQELEAEED